jgi:hypothetical protein
MGDRKLQDLHEHPDTHPTMRRRARAELRNRGLLEAELRGELREDASRLHQRAEAARVAEREKAKGARLSKGRAPVTIRHVAPEARRSFKAPPVLSTFPIKERGRVIGHHVYHRGRRVGRIIDAHNGSWWAQVPATVEERRFGTMDRKELPEDITPGSHLDSTPWGTQYDAGGHEYDDSYRAIVPSRWKTIGFGNSEDEALDNFDDHLPEGQLEETPFLANGSHWTEIGVPLGAAAIGAYAHHTNRKLRRRARAQMREHDREWLHHHARYGDEPWRSEARRELARRRRPYDWRRCVRRSIRRCGASVSRGHGGRDHRRHRALGVPEGEKIPPEKLKAALNSKDPKVRRMAVLARTFAQARR